MSEKEGVSFLRGRRMAARLEKVLQEHDPPLGARELSRMMGLSNNTVGGLLHNLRTKEDHYPSGRTLDRLVAVTGVSLHWLLRGEGPMYASAEPSIVDPEFPNRGLATALARSEGLLEAAISSALSESPAQDLRALDWFKLMLRFHNQLIECSELDTWSWSTDSSGLIIECEGSEKVLGKTWEQVSGKNKEIGEALASEQRFSGIVLNVRGRLTKISGWPRFGKKGALEGFDGEGNFIGDTAGERSSS